MSFKLPLLMLGHPSDNAPTVDQRDNVSDKLTDAINAQTALLPRLNRRQAAAVQLGVDAMRQAHSYIERVKKSE